MTLSPPIRIFAIVGVLAALGLGVFFFVAGRTAGESLSTPVTTPAQTTEQPTRTKKPATTPVQRRPANRTPVETRSGFPVPVDRALRRHRVVVVVVYMPGASVDAVVRAEARAAASGTRVGFVAMSALSERLVRPLVAKTGVLPDPAVVVVKRPGVVTKTFGVTDRATVAQAVVQARR